MLTKIYLGIIGVLIVIAVVLYIKNLDYQKNLEKAENGIIVLNQTNQALIDQSNMKADSIQNYALFVQDLQTVNSKLKNEYRVLVSKYILLLDSVKVINDSAGTEITDSSIVVTFSGNQNKYFYSGNTIYDRLTRTSTHSLFINRDPIKISSEIFLDENKILRNLIFADGALIENANTVIDSSVLIMLNRSELDSKDKLGFFDRLNVYSELNSIYQELGDWTTTRLEIYIGLSYRFDTGFTPYILRNVAGKDYLLGISYEQSVRNLVKNIF
jgi:type II secretory pathway pseudopilin PulG